LKIFNPSIF